MYQLYHKLDVIAPLVTDSSCSNPTLFQNPHICQPPTLHCCNFESIMRYQIVLDLEWTNYGYLIKVFKYRVFQKNSVSITIGGPLAVPLLGVR